MSSVFAHKKFREKKTTFYMSADPDKSVAGSGVRSPWSVVRGPGSGVRDPGSGVRGPGSGLRAPGAGLWASGHLGLRASGHPAHGLRAPGSGLWAMGSELRATGYRLRAPGSVLRAPCSVLRAPCSVLGLRPFPKHHAPFGKTVSEQSRFGIGFARTPHIGSSNFGIRISGIRFYPGSEYPGSRDIQSPGISGTPDPTD